MAIFSSASRAAVVLLVCPACRERQARASAVEGDEYECRACHHRFTKAAGLEAAKEHEDAARGGSNAPRR